MNKLIDMQKAFDAVCKYFHLGNAMECERLVKALEEAYELTAQSERWIPCSEKLPEDGMEVFVYLYYSPKIPYIAWIKNGRWYTEEFEIDREYEPLAWMPLPEPYERSKDTDEIN